MSRRSYGPLDDGLQKCDCHVHDQQVCDVCQGTEPSLHEEISRLKSELAEAQQAHGGTVRVELFDAMQAERDTANDLLRRALRYIPYMGLQDPGELKAAISAHLNPQPKEGQ